MPWKTEKYVLCAFKVKNDKNIIINRDVVFSTGYLLDNNWQITRDITKAFVYESYKDEFDDYYAQPRVSVLYNGYFIQTIKFDKAQEWLNQHPLPRKRIDNTTRLTVYKKYHERCAYCGCELKYEEMQVDHFIPYMNEGGEEKIENYYPACKVCNHVKSNLTIEKFRENIRHCGFIHRNRKKPCMFDSDKIAIKYNLTNEDHEIIFYFEKKESE